MASSPKKRPTPPSRRDGQTGGSSTASRRAQLAAQRESAARARKRNRIITAVLVGVVVLVMGVAAALQVRSMTADQPALASGEGELVRDNSHRLSTAPEGSVTFVEFLDFECEACGAAFPGVEQLRAEFGDRVTFVARYFPLDGHFNAMRAARAVEAAAQQGKFDAMYQKMYQTQTQWSEQQIPKDDVFRGYAEELGLDMAKWDAAYASEATTARIQTDIDDGTALGVTGTPTFFLDGKRLEPRSLDDLTTAVEQALDQQ